MFVQNANSQKIKNGKGDLSVMSIEVYEQLVGRSELYGLIHEGMEDIAAGTTKAKLPAKDSEP